MATHCLHVRENACEIEVIRQLFGRFPRCLLKMAAIIKTVLTHPLLITNVKLGRR